MPSQGLKSYGTYYTASTTNGITAYINLSKQFRDIQMVIPLYNSSYNKSPLNLSLIYSRSFIDEDPLFKTNFKLSIIKELYYINNNKYKIINSDLSVEEYIYSSSNNRYENDKLLSYIIIGNNEYKLVYKDSVYTFDDTYRLRKIEDRSNHINKIYVEYHNGKIETIRNNQGEYIDFFVNNNGQLEITISKENVNIYKIMVYFYNYHIEGINYYVINNNTNNLVKEVEFAYNNYIEVYDCISEERIRVKQISSNNYQVLEGNSDTESLLRQTEITYIDKYHTSVSFNNMYTHYYFDSNYLINHIVDNNSYINGYEYSNYNKLLFKSNPFKNNYLHQAEINNLIVDGFCIDSNHHWNNENNVEVSYITNDNSHVNVTSPKCLKIYNDVGTSSNISQLINVNGTPLDLYTFRFLSKRISNSGSGVVSIEFFKNNEPTTQTITYPLKNINDLVYFNVISIEPLYNFDQILVNIYLVGSDTSFIFDSICLVKQIAGTRYGYDNNLDVIKKTNGVNFKKYTRNNRHIVNSVSTKFNINQIDYSYVHSRDNDLIEDDLVKVEKGLFGSYSSYEYNNYNLLEIKKRIIHEYDPSISYDRALYLKQETTYNNTSEFITSEKIEDKTINYTDDGTKHYLLKRINLPNGVRLHYNYNSRNDLVNFGVNNSDNTPSIYDNNIGYNSNVLKVDNYVDKGNNKVKYNYSSENRLSSVRLLDANNNYKSLSNIKYVNESSNNAPHLDLIESKEYGDNGDKYIFEYDNKYNISTIKLKNKVTSEIDDKFSFGYDSYNRLSSIAKIIDEDTQITKSIYYDSEDRVNKIIEGNHTYNLKYDNEGLLDYLCNCEQNIRTFQSFNNSNKCNERSPEKFYEFIKTINQSDSNCNCYSCFFNEWIEDSQSIIRLNDLTEKDSNGNSITGAYDLSHNNIAKTVKLIPELELGASDSNRLNYDLSSLNTKSILTFFSGDASGTLLSVTTNNNDIIEICKYSSEIEIDKNGNHLGSVIQLTLGTFKKYVLALVIDGTVLHIFINDLHYVRTLSATSFTNLKYGKTYLLNQGHIVLNGIIVTSINDLAFIKLLSKEGYNALYESVYDKGNFCASSVEETILIDEGLANEFTVFPLNNSFEAINENNNIKLSEYTKRSNSLDSDDFIFNNKNDKYSLLLDYNKVIYKTNLTDEGTILANFTISEYSLFASEKVLFRLYNANSEISLFINADKELVLKLNYYVYNLGLHINSYNFNKIGFSYKSTNTSFKYRIYINDETIDSSKPLFLDLSDSLNLQLGNTYDLSIPFNGYLETLCINDSFNTLTYLSNYIDKINISNYLTAYDELGRIKGKKIRYDDNSYNNYQYVTIEYNKYEYEKDANDGANLTSRIKSESFNLSDSSSFSHNYSYNANGRITNITSGNTPLKEYEYNVYGYITKDKNYYNGIYKQNNYEYDGSGNITKRIKSGSNITTETLNYEYGYVNNDNHTINKNALVRIKNGNTIIESITYDNYMNSLPTSITKNNVTSLLNWEGMKLKSYGNISYDYDYLGRRISKQITGGKSYKYNYDIRGNMVSEEITSNNVTTIIRYLYDVNNNVYGLIYNGNIYYYVKNILGEILYIIDKYGDVRVEYKYDAFGNILSISGNMSTTLGNNNHYVYKSYYIDYENDLYYLKSRYYNPSWGRFISSDKIEYLDPSVASGLNLYAYCLNNPVMYDDPEGMTWRQFWGVVAAIAFATAVLSADAPLLGGWSLLAYAAIGFGNLSAIMKSNQDIADNGEIKPMDIEQYNSINSISSKYDTDEGPSGNTTGLTTEDKIAYIRRFREQKPEISKKWTESQMLREMNYHDAAYKISEGLWNVFGISDNCIKVDFEGDVNMKTYIFRIIGNLLW